MKELLKKAFKETLEYAERKANDYTTKKVEERIEIDGFSLQDFLEKVETIEDKDSIWICGSNYDGAWLYYTKTTEATKEDKKEYKIEQFNNFIWKFVYNTLADTDKYRRSDRFDSYGFREIGVRENDLYDLYISEDWDKIEKYFSYFYELISK